MHKTTRPLPKFRAAKPTQQIAIREQIERTAAISKRFLLPNITYILIIHPCRACGKDIIACKGHEFSWPNTRKFLRFPSVTSALNLCTVNSSRQNTASTRFFLFFLVVFISLFLHLHFNFFPGVSHFGRTSSIAGVRTL